MRVEEWERLVPRYEQVTQQVRGLLCEGCPGMRGWLAVALPKLSVTLAVGPLG
jgi:hypothetical protein